MAKKSIWVDNTRPPTNYIWAKTDSSGKIIGVYEYTGTSWIELISKNNPDADVPTGDGVIKAITLSGESINISYSMSELPGTVAIRTDKGTLMGETPSGEDPKELVTVELLSWKENY